MADSVATLNLERENTELKRLVEQLRLANSELRAHLHESSADLDMAHEQISQLAAIVECSEDAIVGCTLNGCVFIWNHGAERLFGYSVEEAMGQPTASNARLNWPEEMRAMKRVRSGEHVPPFETVRRRKDGREIYVSVSISPIKHRDGRIVGVSLISRDISERRQLEEQVRQSQKMEAVGQLAGGIAHDFNNLLTIISGYSELLLDSHTEDAESVHLQEIRKAAQRAASLTRQLLAFSRKQMLEMRVLDLNEIITDVEKMLRRLIGEDILLATKLNPYLKLVRGDPSQIEQVIMNLAVNARDAMPKGGKLLIETSNFELNEPCAQLSLEAKQGQYVMLAFSDTGCGMTPEVKAHMFEPFFTTKDVGKGTGLGLATVYGIIKQIGGYIYVYSEPGHGTTFKIYLPALEEEVATEKSTRDAPATVRGNETILLVEDDEPVRTITRLAIQAHGYQVLEAGGAEEAMMFCAKHQGPIHLLVTDVVMPITGGRQLAERVLAMRHGIRVLYLSGYTDDAVVRHGVLGAEVHFLQKPFIPAALVAKMRDILAR